MLKDIVDITSILGSLSLVVSVLLLIRELRENNRLTRATNAQAMVELSSPFYTTLFQDRQLAELLLAGAHDFAKLDAVDQYRYRQLLIWWLIFHENIFYQRRQGLLDKRMFTPWSLDLQIFIKQQNLEMHWSELKKLFHEEFAEHVSQMITAPNSPLPPPVKV